MYQRDPEEATGRGRVSPGHTMTEALTQLNAKAEALAQRRAALASVADPIRRRALQVTIDQELEALNESRQTLARAGRRWIERH
jgi:hypothetical protein